MNPIAVLGANGVYGRHLIPRLAAAGYPVRALVRRPEAAAVARACGADVRTADIFDEARLRQALDGCELAINLATSLPGPSGRGDFESNDRVRRDGVPVLIRACEAVGVRRLLQQSIAWVDAEDETAAPEPSVSNSASNATKDMETAVRGSSLDWLILRGAYFYGPGTGTEEGWLARAAVGKLRVPGDGSGFVSLVHIADMAAATVAAIDRWHSKETIAIADDAPVRWLELFQYISAMSGTPQPEQGGRLGFPSFRISNERARALLGWAPAYPDYRTGLAR